ncbi:hypothetical protein EJ08DRAFT_119045 [Tothia fuscella]|uniref:Uncharacterized protein n=1 Tax=Tothia fuscella TaxID=1048955 RepID=A0A9P4NW74_9PEZI|nr:hypothetical protein EJ08DRAFT_119045 [Tothia fuscella]
MAKLLSRSKSFRQLRPLRKDSKGPAVPEHDVWETHFSDLDRAQGNTNQQAKTTVGNFTFAIESAGDIARPKTANEAVDRRELMAMGSPISVTSGKETFAFPTPVRRPFTPNSADIKSAGMESNPSDIGLAIGSPSHDTRFQLDNSWTLSPPQGLLIAPNRETLTPISTTARSQTSYSNRAIQGEWKEKNEVAKPKISRWRSLGGLFARRPPARASPEPQYQTISQQRLPNPFDLNTENYALPWQGEAAPNVVYSLPHNFGNPVRSDSPKKSSPRPRWGLLRSQTAPTTRRGETSPLPPSKGPVLDVDIPTTKMERYSVMFNGVITKKSSSSLLVRRQANADNKSQVPGESLKVKTESQSIPTNKD